MFTDVIFCSQNNKSILQETKTNNLDDVYDRKKRAKQKCILEKLQKMSF